MATVFTIMIARYESSAATKIVFVGCLPILMAAMLLTESRTGMLALMAVLAAMGLASRSRFYAWSIAFGAVLLLAVRPDMVAGFWERVTSTYNPEAGGMLDPSTQTRLDIWKAYASAATPQVWLLGQGRTVPVLQLGAHPHNTYLSALFLHGLGGLVWFLWFFGTMIRRSGRLARSGAEPYRTVGAAVLWGLAVWGLAGLTLDLLVTQIPQVVYLFCAVAVDRSTALARTAGAAHPRTGNQGRWSVAPSPRSIANCRDAPAP
jgi:O-antigen ligase